MWLNVCAPMEKGPYSLVVRPACTAGSELDGTGRRGAITLLFRNRAHGADGRALALTCAHVVGDLSRSEPFHPDVSSYCCPGTYPFGSAVWSSTYDSRGVEYDIALVRLSERADSGCSVQPYRSQDGIRLNGFIRRDRIYPGMNVRCDFPRSRIRSSIVNRREPLPVRYVLAGREVPVRNAFSLRSVVQEGDSGGLIYRDDRAVGILFGRSADGIGWFHALEDAVEFMARQYAAPVSVF